MDIGGKVLSCHLVPRMEFPRIAVAPSLAARGVCHMNPTGLGMALSKIPFFFFIFSTRKQRGQRTHRAARQQQQGRAMALQGAAHQGPALGHLQHRLGGLREGREETSPQTCAGEDPDGEGFSLR